MNKNIGLSNILFSHTLNWAYRNNNYFSIVVIGRNCKWTVERILESVCYQAYFNLSFEVTYIDMESDDGTWDIVQEYQYKNHYFMRSLRNDPRRTYLENLILAVKLAKEKSIIVLCENEHDFPDNMVLDRLNKLYTKDMWMNICPATGLKTWRRELFLKVNDKDFRDNGNYLSTADPTVFLYPMMAMAGKYFISNGFVFPVDTNYAPLERLY